MGEMVILTVPCAKGVVCYCLDQFSKGRGARSRVRGLNDAIIANAPNYADLADVFDEYLLSHVIEDPARRQRYVRHLKEFWFGPDAKFFPGVPVARIYAEGVCKALELSLRGRRVVPINAWWVLDSSEFRMLTLADLDGGGVPVGGRVTLLIMTPRPSYDSRPGREPSILGTEAQAWVTERQGHETTTRNVRDIRQ